MIEKLLKQLKIRKDEAVFEKLYLELNKSVFAVCFSYTRDYQLSQDIQQDTFINVLKYIESYKGGSGKYWVLSIAKNLSLNALQKRKRQREKETYIDDMVVDIPDANQTIQIKDESGIIKVCKMVLNENEQKIVFMHTLGEVKLVEIAKILGASSGTTRWQYKNALKKVREYMQKEGLNE